MTRPETEYISWTALALSIVAMVIALNTSNTVAEISRSNQVIVQDDRVNENQDVRVETRDWLVELNRSFEGSGDVDEQAAAREISEFRQSLSNTFSGSEGERLVEWREVDQSLEELEMNFREGAADAIESVRSFLAQLEAEVEE